ncbi:hypothetical protein M5X00_26370 [Paenibacillus alvei]|uniref:hypothetical protein n=1 Tax=Paenibacillus alvei TaxID=44250 RepID=UPI0022820E62|nr:hypothetical protein [Paenibacillus alvei]MCY9757758.1 hypothetical protein [Paenibacillus alvei]
MGNRGTKKGVRGTGITSTRNDDEVIYLKKKQIGSLLRTRMKEQKIPYRKLEEVTSVYASQLTQMTNGKGNYVIDNFLRVVDALDLKLVLMEKEDEEHSQSKLDLIIKMLEEMKVK